MRRLITHIYEAIEVLEQYNDNLKLVLLESTTPPGTLHLFASALNNDVCIAYSPERFNPGSEWTLQQIPKIVAGITSTDTDIACLFYEQFIEQTVPVSSPVIAAMAKLLENAYRYINIGFINEFADLCKSQGLDVYEVIDAASSKPFGFMPFYPGPGVGGHCLPIASLFLRTLESGQMSVLDAAHSVNLNKPDRVNKEIVSLLKRRRVKIKGARLLILGIAYKPDVDDVRDSPAVRIMANLQKQGAILSYHDRFCTGVMIEDTYYASQPLTEDVIKEVDAVIVLAAHQHIDYEWVVKHARQTIDAVNATIGIAKRVIRV